MKKHLLAAALTFFLCSAASAAEVPDNTPWKRVQSFDIRAYLVVRKQFECNENEGLTNDAFKLTCTDALKQAGYGKLTAGARIPIAFLSDKQKGDFDIVIGAANGSILHFDGDMPISGKYPYKTVRELKDFLRGWMTIESDDPYLQLDAPALRDLLLKKIVAQIQEHDYQGSLPNFSRLESVLEYLGEVPESFAFYYIQAFYGVGDKPTTRRRIELYLNKFGKSGKYYKKVMEIQSAL